MKNRNDILKAAARAITAAPRSSMAEIASAIGIGRTTLHRHFATRDDLLRALPGLGMQLWRETIQAADLDSVMQSEDPNQVRETITQLVRSYADQSDLFGPTLTTIDPVGDTPELRAEVAELTAQEQRLFAHAQSLGVLRADLSPAWIDWVMVGLIIACRDAVRYGDIGHRAAAELTVTSFFDGCAVR